MSRLRRWICRTFHKASWVRTEPGKRRCGKCGARWVGQYGTNLVSPANIGVRHGVRLMAHKGRLVICQPVETETERG